MNPRMSMGLTVALGLGCASDPGASVLDAAAEDGAPQADSGPVDARADAASPADAQADIGPGGFDASDAADAQDPGGPLFVDVTGDQLPETLGGFSMDARPVDVDGDDDLDLVIAHEFRPNILLINDGAGRFDDVSATRLPRTRRDSEDVVAADFDGDGDVDLFFASEDDRTNELFLAQDGAFVDASDRIPVRGVSNAAILDPSFTAATILIGNAGQNLAIQWSTDAGAFVDVTAQILPVRVDVTQDLELGDVDGDGDLDLAVGNEDASVILLREGGRFGTAVELSADAETREIDLFDADGDGDLDVVLANIRFIRRDVNRQNRLLIQIEDLVFVDETESRMPGDDDDSFDIDAVDLDGDGDLDLISANLDALSGSPASAPYRAYVNDGRGRFGFDPELLPATAVGNGFDVEAADFDGDGDEDLFLASRGGTDRLLIRR